MLKFRLYLMLCEMNALQCVSYLADVLINKLSIRSNPFFVRLCCSIVKNHEKCHQLVALQYHHRVDYYLPIALVQTTIHLSLIRLQMAKRGLDDIVFNHRDEIDCCISRQIVDINNRIFFQIEYTQVGTNQCQYHIYILLQQK